MVIIEWSIEAIFFSFCSYLDFALCVIMCIYKCGKIIIIDCDQFVCAYIAVINLNK